MNPKFNPKHHARKRLGPSWRTSLLGFSLILLGLWVGYVHWVPNQTLYFNIVYVEPPAIALLACGWLGIHARDQRAHDEENP